MASREKLSDQQGGLEAAGAEVSHRHAGVMVYRHVRPVEFGTWLSSSDSRGRILRQQGAMYSDVIDRGADNDHSASSLFFNYHYDGAYLPDQPAGCALYCVQPGRGGTPTALVRSSDLLARVLETGAALSDLAALQWEYSDKSGTRVARPLVQRHPANRSLLLRCSVGMGALKWRDERRRSDTHGPERVWRLVTEAASSLPSVLHHWEVGDLVMWDNWSLLHARLGEKRDARRHLKRVWLRNIEPAPAGWASAVPPRIVM